MGDGGTGKTFDVGSLVDCGIEVFYCSLEQGMESLVGYWSDRGLPVPKNLHWHKIEPPKASFLALAKTAYEVNTLSFESLAKRIDVERHLHNTMVKVNEAFYNFIDQRTGVAYGSVDTWAPDRAIVVDGLTGLSRAAMSLMVGGKPLKNMGDYQVAQGQLENFLRLICDHCRCWFILLAHVEKEVDPIVGGYKITVAVPGQKLAPLIPPMFSDVVYCVRDGVSWSWNTASNGAATKARNLPWGEKLEPSFVPLYERWKQRCLALETGAEAVDGAR